MMVTRERGFAGERLAGLGLAGASMLVMVQASAEDLDRRRTQHDKGGVAGIVALAPGSSDAEDVSLSIPKGPLETALVAFTDQAKVKLVYATELTERLTTKGVEGAFQPLDALSRILDGTGLTFRAVGPSTITLVNPRYVQLSGQPANAVALDELHVAGQGGGTTSGQPPQTGTVGQPPVPYVGGQVATGARVGALGNRSILKTPFNVTGYTEKLISDQQARSVADVIPEQPVRAQRRPALQRARFVLHPWLLGDQPRHRLRRPVLPRQPAPQLHGGPGARRGAARPDRAPERGHGTRRRHDQPRPQAGLRRAAHAGDDDLLQRGPDRDASRFRPPLRYVQGMGRALSTAPTGTATRRWTRTPSRSAWRPSASIIAATVSAPRST